MLEPDDLVVLPCRPPVREQDWDLARDVPLFDKAGFLGGGRAELRFTCSWVLLVRADVGAESQGVLTFRLLEGR